MDQLNNFTDLYGISNRYRSERLDRELESLFVRLTDSNRLGFVPGSV